jgi:hypothetical protein
MIKIATKQPGIIFWIAALATSIVWQFLRLVLTNVPGITISSRILVLGAACLMLALPLLLGTMMIRRGSDYKIRWLKFVMLIVLMFEVAQCIVGFVEVARANGIGHI